MAEGDAAMSDPQPMETRLVRTWYRSLRGGEVWCESSSAAEVRERSKPSDKFERVDIYEIHSPWHSWDPYDTL